MGYNFHLGFFVGTFVPPFFVRDSVHYSWPTALPREPLHVFARQNYTFWNWGFARCTCFASHNTFWGLTGRWKRRSWQIETVWPLCCKGDRLLRLQGMDPIRVKACPQTSVRLRNFNQDLIICQRYGEWNATSLEMGQKKSAAAFHTCVWKRNEKTAGEMLLEFRDLIWFAEIDEYHVTL